MSERNSYFIHSASGSAFGGILTTPNPLVIPTQAMVSLSASGGYATATVENFGIDGLLSVRKATSTVQGDPKQTELTITIEGVNLLNVVTVERMVVHLVGQPAAVGREAAITPAGSVLEGLKVHGKAADAKSKADVFDRHNTYAGLEKAHAAGELKGLILHPGKLGAPCSAADLHGCKTAVGDIKGTLFPAEGFPDWLPVVNGGLRVKDFATLHLGEYRITKHARRLTMLRVELGCDQSGSISFADGVGNGHEEPPA